MCMFPYIYGVAVSNTYWDDISQWQIQDFLQGGRGPLTRALFGKNVCQNERIGSHGGACAWHHEMELLPPRSGYHSKKRPQTFSMVHKWKEQKYQDQQMGTRTRLL